MDREVSRLILYSDLKSDEILVQLAAVCRDLREGTDKKDHLVHRVNLQIKRLLDLSTAMGFDRNLWQNYLTFLMISHENSFSLTCERVARQEGSIRQFAIHDFAIFRTLLHWDFRPLEEELGICGLSLLCDYSAIVKRDQLYNHRVSENVCSLSEKLDACTGAEEIYDLLTEHFHREGVGLLGLNTAFRVAEEAGRIELIPVNNLERVTLSHLIGYDTQKSELRANVEAFLRGRPFNNMLLYGDAGTGKSTSVKAALNEYAQEGLRMVELSKHQFHLLAPIISLVKLRNYRFMIFLDDLSFEENEVEYKYLKAVIEGGLETRPENVMIVATSNRRHLIREVWSDRSDMEKQEDVHRSDTMQEKLSLSARFGCSIAYAMPGHRLFQQIVLGLAARHPEIPLSESELLLEAQRYEMRHGGESGRCAQQFMNQLLGRLEEEKP
ncbi:MAG: ATP-binding protein [Clostridia bacterium]|nr:ATP-binding protein [Clostridia bacterium]